MIIKWYNNPAIQHEMLGMAMCNTDYMQESQVNDLVGLFAVGRLLGITGPINRNHQFVFKFDFTPLPEDWHSTMTFGESCLRTAEDLWHTAAGRHVALYWSGGIDSTTALVALIQTNSRWRDQIRIYTSPYAIEQEYPRFYQQYLQDLDVSILQDRELFSPTLFGPDVLVTDGACGDQMWGCNALKNIPALWQRPYSELWHTDQFRQCVIDWQQDAVIDYIEQQIHKFQPRIDTVADLYWMLTFTHKWDYVRRRHMARVPDIRLFDDMHSFFNSFHLQRWAMTNSEPKLGSAWNTYKQPAKDFIYSFTKDQDYRINKLQTPSLPRSVKAEVMEQSLYFQLVTDQGFKTRSQMDGLIWRSFEWHWPPECVN